MKKVVSLVLAAFVLLGSAPLGGLVGFKLPSLGVLSEAATDSALYYELSSDKTYYKVYLTKYSTGKLIIPNTYSGKPVKEIAHEIEFFEGDNPTITSIVIPANITKIDTMALRRCEKLTTISVSSKNKKFTVVDGVLYDITKTQLLFCPENRKGTFNVPANVTKIADSAFSSCKYITSFTLSNNIMTIESSAFAGCSITKIKIPNKITAIKEWCFAECEKLTSIVIPDSVKAIGKGAFYGCSSLTSFTVPKSVKSIEGDIFKYCTSLKKVILSKSTEKVDITAFRYCKKLVEINVPADNSVYLSLDGVLFDKSKQVIYYCPEGKTGEFTIPESVFAIHSYDNCDAFSFNQLSAINCDANNQDFYSVDGVLFRGVFLLSYPGGKIGPYTTPNNIRYISSDAFRESSGITEITITDNVKQEIYAEAFKNCKNLKTVTIGKGVTGIGARAFDFCSSLETINFSQVIKYIDEYAFSSCYSLKHLVLPDSITGIGIFSFQDCKSLESVVIGDGLKYLPDGCFVGCESLSKITFGKNIKVIDNAFSFCSKLTSVKIPDGVEAIGDFAFYRCTELQSVSIPSSVVEIGMSCFKNCPKLHSVTVPNSVKAIGEMAFGYYYDDNWDTKQYSNFTIKGFKNSTAQKYAVNNGIKFVEVAPALPKLSSIKNSSTGVAISWEKSSRATGYKIFRKTANDTGWTRINTVKATASSYIDTSAKSGTVYSYTVIAYNSGGNSNYDKNGLKILVLTCPKLSVPKNTQNGILVSWGGIKGAKGYRLYRKTDTETSWSLISLITDAHKTNYTDQNVKSGKKYIYTVRAYNGNVKSGYNIVGASVLRLATPSVLAGNSTSGINVKWSKTAGAKGYYIYRKADSATSWTRVKTITNGSTVTWKDRDVINGTTYKYTVMAFNGNTLSRYIKDGAIITFLSAPKVSKLTSRRTGITVNWDKNAKATGYIVYRKTEGVSWTVITKINDRGILAFEDTSAEKGVTYTYAVRAYKDSYRSSYYSDMTIKDKY